MRMIAIFVLMILTLFSLPIRAQVVEIQNFEQINEYLRPKTLLVLDIDDTLLVPVQMVGCDEWFAGRMSELRNNGLTAAQCLDRCLGDWEAIRHITKMELVEPGQEKTLAAMQARGVTVMGMTTQGLALADRTHRQLNHSGINLSITAPSANDHYVLVGEHGTLYRHGIYFTSGTHKGKALMALLDQMKYEPEHIVYVNDKDSYLYRVDEAAQERGIPYVGIRYGHSDYRKEAFEYGIADFQFRHSSFAYILSDDEARSQMKCRP